MHLPTLCLGFLLHVAHFIGIVGTGTCKYVFKKPNCDVVSGICSVSYRAVGS